MSYRQTAHSFCDGVEVLCRLCNLNCAAVEMTGTLSLIYSANSEYKFYDRTTLCLSRLDEFSQSRSKIRRLFRGRPHAVATLWDLLLDWETRKLQHCVESVQHSVTELALEIKTSCIMQHALSGYLQARRTADLGC